MNGFKGFHQRGHPGPAPTVQCDAPTGPDQAGQGDQHSTHAWSRHTLEERRLKKRDEYFRSLVELEAELLHEVERDA